MTLFEQIIIPLLDHSLEFGDIAPLSGFVDSYTNDPDRPCADKSIYLVYDDSIRTENTMRTASRLEKLSTIKYTYIKMVDGKPLRIHKFYVNPEAAKLFDGIIELTPEQVCRIISFWGYTSSIAEFVCKNAFKSVSTDHNMPLEDYVTEDIPTKKGVTIR